MNDFCFCLSCSIASHQILVGIEQLLDLLIFLSVGTKYTETSKLDKDIRIAICSSIYYSVFNIFFHYIISINQLAHCSTLMHNFDLNNRVWLTKFIRINKVFITVMLFIKVILLIIQSRYHQTLSNLILFPNNSRSFPYRLN